MFIWLFVLFWVFFFIEVIDWFVWRSVFDVYFIVWLVIEIFFSFIVFFIEKKYCYCCISRKLKRFGKKLKF